MPHWVLLTLSAVPSQVEAEHPGCNGVSGNAWGSCQVRWEAIRILPRNLRVFFFFGSPGPPPRLGHTRPARILKVGIVARLF